MVKIKQGDLLKAKEDIICHQVNVQGIMGGGIARQLANQYSDLEEEYKNFCSMHNYNYNLLKGKVFKIMIQGKFIMNMFSQKENFDTDYEMLKIALKEIKEFAEPLNLSIAIPYKIGCGIANGDWNTVLSIIDEVFRDYKVTLYKLEKN